MTQAHILVVDDEPDIRELIGDILGDEGYTVTRAASAAEAREARRQRRPDLVLLDIWMPDLDGVSLLREWHDRGGLPCPVVMISGHGTIETAIEATRLGAYDFIEKPVALAKLLLTVRRALESHALKRENEGLKAQLGEPAELVGTSKAMQMLRSQLERAAGSEVAVLIEGPQGSGREAVARALHARGSRRSGPFVRIACAGLTGERASAVLRGEDDTRGVSYGLFDQAAGGCLYLDGVHELPPLAQHALAQALDAREFLRDGGRHPIKLDCRVIAATDRSLNAAVVDGRFRDDLFYQLNVLALKVAPLSERIEDVPELASWFADWYATREDLGYRRFSVAAQNRLRQHSWPGNLRELRNLVQRLLILGRDGDVEADEVDQLLTPLGGGPRGREAPAAPAIDYTLPLREARDAFERDYLLARLAEVNGSVGQLASLVGMERTHLYRKLRDLGIDVKSLGRTGT
jgi:DNA-binding NtrC family response regulator